MDALADLDVRTFVDTPLRDRERLTEPSLGGSEALTVALATTTRGLSLLLTSANRRLHVVAPALELSKDALGSHLALEVLHRALEALFSDYNLDGLALDRLTNRHRLTLSQNGRGPWHADLCGASPATRLS
jgi:hypothetical protein